MVALLPVFGNIQSGQLDILDWPQAHNGPNRESNNCGANHRQKQGK